MVYKGDNGKLAVI